MTYPRTLPADLADQTPQAASLSALLGHDLRAAVSDIIGGLRLIDHQALDPATRVQLERVRAAGEGLARLLEEGLAAMLGEEAAAPDIHPANLHLPRLLYDAEMRWSGRAREKGLGFGLSVGAGVPQVVAVNRIALERILSNVLSNAIKYTDSGAVSVGVEHGADGTLCFRVRDDGPGFSDAALARLFQPGGRPGGTDKPGSGLGLHITKEMADRLGGTVTVANRNDSGGGGGGAEVLLRLPRAAWTPTLHPGGDDALPDLSRVKVLLAEDSETNQLLVGRMLARLGAEYEVAADGVEALNWLDRESFDLALIDIEMPRLSGIEVIRALRARGGVQAAMPVIAVTAYVLRANREAIYAAGADRILAKPIGGLAAFAHALAEALGQEGALPAPGTEGEAEPAAMDHDRFHHLIDIAGPSGSAELLRRLQTDLGVVERGLVHGLAGSDWAEIRAQSHVLIALSGAVGADRLMQLARALNTAVHRRETDDLTRLGPETLRLLDDLIHFVASQAPPPIAPAGTDPPDADPTHTDPPGTDRPDTTETA